MIEIEDLKLYNIQEVCEKLHLTQKTLYQYRRKGKIRSQRIGKNVYITEDELRRFIMGKEHGE